MRHQPSVLTLDTIRDISLYQSKGGYRFSVDALLLVSFVNLPRAVTIADLGAGSGVIGLLLAKRYRRARVTLVEIQPALAALAAGNADLNGLCDRVAVLQRDIRSLAPAPDLPDAAFDLVVSNPPFRRPQTGLISVSDERALARHELHLPLDDLSASAASLLRHHGRFCIIHLPERLSDVVLSLRSHSLEPKRLRFVHSKAGTGAKMVLVEAVKSGRPGMKVEAPLFLYHDDGTYTAEARDICGAS